MSANFEVKHTVRLYDSNLIISITKLFERLRKSYFSKNEFLTDLLKLGLHEMEKRLSSQNESAQKTGNIEEGLDEILIALNETSRYMIAQFKGLCVNHGILERLLSSVYHMLIGINDGEHILSEKVNDGFYDDLPTRFERIIARLEQRYGLK